MSRASAALATNLVAVGSFAAPAGAADVAQVPLGSTIQELVIGADGGAWVSILPTGNGLGPAPGPAAIGHATPAGAFTSARLKGDLRSAALGPDGQAWFRRGQHEFVRSDRAGKVTRVPLASSGPPLDGGSVTGSDGTLWTVAKTDDRIVHVAPSGAVTSSRLMAGGCTHTEIDTNGPPSFQAMERAADGAIWAADAGCPRLLRIAAAGTTATALDPPGPGELAADATGGMWFAGDQPGHVDAAGAVRRVTLREATATDVAVASDGSAWLATGTCFLARVSPAGVVSSVPAPVPAIRIGFDSADGMWLASGARLVHTAPGERSGPCDHTPPSVRLRTGRSTISLRALRRAGGIVVLAREPVSIVLDGIDSQGELSVSTIPGAHGGSVLLRVPPAQVRRYARRVARGERVAFTVSVKATDREGNSVYKTYGLRVRR